MVICKLPVTDGIGIDDEGKMMPTQGAIVPDGYTQYGNESNSWVCPHFNVSVYSSLPILTREL